MDTTINFVTLGINNSLEMLAAPSEYGDILYDYYSGEMISISVPNVLGYYQYGGVNDCGQVVGTYADGSQNAHGFLATPRSVAIDDCAVNLLGN